MIQLITATEFSNYRDISKKVDIPKINECIKFAQTVDLYDVLGDFYFDVIQNKDTTTYQDLLSGSTFQIDNESYVHSGLNSLLSDYAYARYVYIINSNFTPFGMQSKFTSDSEQVDRSMVKDIVKQTQIDADIKFKIIDKYLKENSSLFSRYCTGNDRSINTFGQKYTIL